MYWTRRHVLVCTSQHCQQKGAAEVVGLLRREVMKRKIGAEIFVNTCGTIDLCDIGPNIVIYPDNVVYRSVKKADLPEIVAFLQGDGSPVERLVLNADSPDEVNRHDFYQTVVETAQPMPSEQFAGLAETYGLDAAWIAEQQRRGFIARKPNEQGAEAITVTTKTRDRYRLTSAI